MAAGLTMHILAPNYCVYSCSAAACSSSSSSFSAAAASSSSPSCCDYYTSACLPSSSLWSPPASSRCSRSRHSTYCHFKRPVVTPLKRLQVQRSGVLYKSAHPVGSPGRMTYVRCAAAVHNRPISGDQMLVFVPPHPLVKHLVSILRSEDTPPPLFRSAMAELGRVLIYEASRDWLITSTGEVQTPCGIASVEFIDPREPVKVVPILRAGLVLVEHIASVLPATQTYHLGYFRDEETLQPKLYLNKLPQKIAANSRVLVTDPMLATGGTIVAALEEIISRGADPKLIRVISAVAAPPALEKLSSKFPGLHVYTGIIDETLNEKGYIVPGLGDAGDRSFGT